MTKLLKYLRVVKLIQLMEPGMCQGTVSSFSLPRFKSAGHFQPPNFAEKQFGIWWIFLETQANACL